MRERRRITESPTTELLNPCFCPGVLFPRCALCPLELGAESSLGDAGYTAIDPFRESEGEGFIDIDIDVDADYLDPSPVSGTVRVRSELSSTTLTVICPHSRLLSNITRPSNSLNE